MPTRGLPQNIQNGQDIDPAEVMANFNRIVEWFVPTAGVGISNGDIATDAAIVGSKINIDSNTDWQVEHADDGVHKIVGPGIDRMYIQRRATTLTTGIRCVAESMMFENSSGVKAKVNDVDSYALITNGVAINGKLKTFTESASTTYYLIMLHDSTNNLRTLVLYARDMSGGFDTDFWETDIPAFNAAPNSYSYNYAKAVGSVYNDSNSNFETPRPIPGGSFSELYLPLPPIISIFSFADGTGGSYQYNLLPFKPDVIVQIPWAATPTQDVVIKDYLMTTNYSKVLGTGEWSQAYIQSLDATGFTTNLCSTGVTYTIIALKVPRGFP